MRESVRISDAEIRQGYDLIIIARNTINGKKCADVKKSIEAALRRLKVIEKKEGGKVKKDSGIRSGSSEEDHHPSDQRLSDFYFTDYAR